MTTYSPYAESRCYAAMGWLPWRDWELDDRGRLTPGRLIRGAAPRGRAAYGVYVASLEPLMAALRAEHDASHAVEGLTWAWVVKTIL